MLWTAYLRRRLVLLGLVLWITSLFVVFSLLAEEVEIRQPSNGRLKLLMDNHESQEHQTYEVAYPVHVRDVITPHPQGQRLTHDANPSKPQLLKLKRVDDLQTENKQLSQRQTEGVLANNYGTMPNVNFTRGGGGGRSLLWNRGVAEYCNRNNVLPTPQEGMAPSGFKLLSVHIVTRHGDLSPLNSFSRHPNPPLSCQFQPRDIFNDSKLAAYVTTMRGWEGRQQEDSGFRKWALYPDRKVCTNSQLTTIGVKQMLELGYMLHELYVQKWKLLGRTFSGSEILVKSTEYTRTYQSAVSFLYAFLPQFNLTKVPIKRASNFFFCTESILAAPCTCPVLRSWKKQAEVFVEDRVENTILYNSLLNAVSSVYDLPRSRLPRMWAMMDVFLSRACNVLPLPCNEAGHCITPQMVSQLWSHVTNYTQTLSKLKGYKQYASLALHPLLSEIVENMLDVANGDRSVKVNLLSGHDSTITPLAVVLGIGGWSWPRYASRIVFELYSKENAPEHYIRVIQDGADVTNKVAMCQGQVGNKMCPLKDFVDFVRKDNLGQFKDNDYINMCYSPS